MDTYPWENESITEDAIQTIIPGYSIETITLSDGLDAVTIDNWDNTVTHKIDVPFTLTVS